MSSMKLNKKQKNKLVNNVNKKIASRIINSQSLPKGIKGRGGYFDNIKSGISKVWSNLNENERPEASKFNKVVNKIGNTIGNEFGIGKQLGNAASWLSRAFGMGKYNIRSNTLAHPNGEMIASGISSLAPPSFGSAKKGSDIIFAHREFIGDITSSIAFTTTTYPINPGNPVLFPWMSQIAILYEEFEMLGMLLEYKSSSGTSNTAAVPGMGLVLMATDYDPYDNSFFSKRQMEAAEFSSSGVPYENFLHAIECDPKRNVLATQYVVPGITNYSQASGDARFSVLGNTTVATVGQQADGVVMGELWCTYHVRLSRPILENSNSVFSQNLEYTMGDTLFTLNKNTVSNGSLGFTVSRTGTDVSSRILIQNTNGRTGFYRVTYVGINDSSFSLVAPTSVVPIYTNVVPAKTGLGIRDADERAAEATTAIYGAEFNYISTGIYNFTTPLISILDLPLITPSAIQIPLNIYIEKVDDVVASLGSTRSCRKVLSQFDVKNFQQNNSSRNIYSKESLDGSSSYTVVEQPNL